MTYGNLDTLPLDISRIQEERNRMASAIVDGVGVCLIPKYVLWTKLEDGTIVATIDDGKAIERLRDA